MKPSWDQSSPERLESSACRVREPTEFPPARTAIGESSSPRGTRTRRFPRWRAPVVEKTVRRDRAGARPEKWRCRAVSARWRSSSPTRAEVALTPRVCRRSRRGAGALAGPRFAGCRRTLCQPEWPPAELRLSNVRALVTPSLTLSVLLFIDTLKTCVLVDALTRQPARLQPRTDRSGRRQPRLRRSSPACPARARWAPRSST